MGNNREMKQEDGRRTEQNAASTGAARLKRRLIAGVLLLLILIGGMTVGIGNYFVNFALSRKEIASEVAPADAVNAADAAEMEAAGEQYAAFRDTVFSDEGLTTEIVSITSDDALRLEADLFTPKAAADEHNYVIYVHGYESGRDTALSRNMISVYLSQGYRVLAPDNRAHGASEGDYIGMGWLDRLDILKWINFLTERDPEANIYLHGVSMGGATVMMLSGEILPDNVKAIVEDCGYSSVWAEFQSELKALYGLPAFPALYMADFMAGIRAGYHFKEASSLKQLQKASVPMLFIHGDADNFVPYTMLAENFAACASDTKEQLTVHGAGHAEAYLREPALYWETVFAFLEAQH